MSANQTTTLTPQNGTASPRITPALEPQGRLKRPGRRIATLASATLLTLTLSITLAPASPALAAPQWGIAIEHHNAYGLQRAECPGGHESLPGEPDCGIDPFTGSGTTFTKESASDTYLLTVTNVGDAPTTGGATVADQLPPGMVLAGNNDQEDAGGPGWSCTIVVGAKAVSCVRGNPTESLAPDGHYGPIKLRVRTGEDATNPSTDVASVSGGGAATITAGDPTTIAEAIPFGVKTFTTSVTEALGDPLSQAAGHPFAASTELVFNYVPNSENAELSTAGGGAKSVEIDLPPGFLGDPQSMPQCPLALLKGADCPADTAVGYTQIALKGEIRGGRAVPFFELPNSFNSSLVYALTPPPGHAAAFGFLDLRGIPFVLYATVRSDGDYGVTIGDEAIANAPRPMATKLTFCANGATHEGGFFASYSCNPVTSGSPPFLTNPARCSSSAATVPRTTARATLWDDPSEEVSKTVPTGLNLLEEQPSEAESFVKGCGDPELAQGFGRASVGLVPDTTRADAPTGIGFDLRLPQSDRFGEVATPELKETMVTLPKGMGVSPSAAAGLEGCSDSQFGLHVSAPGACPMGSQVGMVEVFTPLLSSGPKVEGTPRSGEKLLCEQGVWDGSPAVVSYQWLRDGVAIAGATGREYLATVGDEGASLQCQITAINGGGGSVAVSRPAVVEPEPAIVPPLPPASLVAPAGSGRVGDTLTCNPGVWTGDPALAYRWLRGGSLIAGAQAGEYTLTGEDAGKAIQCQVTGVNAGGIVLADSAAVVVSPSPSVAPVLLGAPLQGRVFIGEPECSPCTASDAENGRVFRLFLEVEDPVAGVIVKLAGSVSASPVTGQLTARFRENPQLPFEDLRLRLKGGPEAPLVTPQACGPSQTMSVLTSWSSEPGLGEAAGTPNATPSSSFDTSWDGNGGLCPSTLPLSPSFSAGTATASADGFSDFGVTFARPEPPQEAEERDEQSFAGVTMQLPAGLLGRVAGVVRCTEAQADGGSCPQASEIGTTTVAAGAGSHPFYLSGRVYLTEGYGGAPFGLAIVVPAKAGPFTLAGTDGHGDVVVRAAIEVNPSTAALTIVSDPLPQVVDGVPLRLHKVRVDVTRPGFVFNATSCAQQAVSASIVGEHVEEGEQNQVVSVSSPYVAQGCPGLPFDPSFSASTRGVTSKAAGASLDVKVSQAPGEANIQKVDVQLPRLLPSRLTTLQQACTEAQFAANPAGCPQASDVGIATVHTPVLENPLVGPAYLVSHGGAAFPDLEIVLQGEGVKLVLDGNTDIKKGVTFSKFETVPDAPISSFELNLPEGPHSVLAAPSGVCGASLVMPTTITAQNGKQIIQNTKIAVNGCVKTKSLTRAQKLAKALKECRKKKNKHKRAACENQARKKYGARTASKTAKQSDRRHPR